MSNASLSRSILIAALAVAGGITAVAAQNPPSSPTSASPERDTARGQSTPPQQDAPAADVSRAEQAAARSQAKSAETPNDQSLLGKLVMLNRAELASVQRALPSLKNVDVRRYADRLVREHGRGLDENDRISSRLRIKPEIPPADPNAPAPVLASGDQQFLEQQVAMHREALEQLQELLPGATDAGLKQHIQRQITMVQEHITSGEKLQAKFRA